MQSATSRRHIGLALVFAILGLAACSSDTSADSTAPPTTAPDQTTATSQQPPSTIFTADVEALWLTDPLGAGVVRVDATDPDEVTGSEVGFAPTAIAAGTGNVWVGGDGVVAALDPTTVAIRGTTEVPGSTTGLVAVQGDVWALLSDSVVPIDGETLSPGEPIDISSPVDGVIMGTDLWVLGADQMVHIDTTAGALIESLPPPVGEPSAIQLLGETLVVVDRSGALAAIDPATGEIIREGEITAGSVAPTGAITDGEQLWILDEAGQLVAVDSDLKQGLSVEVGTAATAVDRTSNAVWVASEDDRSLVRITLNELKVLIFPLNHGPTSIAAS
ncbi:MAG: hypothetical protein QNJ77_04885 [Acidimicrobiia bacterium]|nr:hypothetical protein [Acidimicrobiia bacterium]